jgi:hypothetical protein
MDLVVLRRLLKRAAAGHCTRFAAAAVLALAMAGLSAGCSSKNDDASSAFCGFLSALNATAGSITSPEDGLRSLKAYESELERQVPAAPADMQTDATVIMNASKAAIQSNDLSALLTADVAQAGERLSSQCGLKPPQPSPTPTESDG